MCMDVNRKDKHTPQDNVVQYTTFNYDLSHKGIIEFTYFW